MSYYGNDDENVSTNCRFFGSNFNLSCVDPAFQYKNLKLIQNTVRVPASLYTSDLGALTVSTQPYYWNQISDRKEPHIQPNLVGGGSFYHGSSTKRTITRERPGAGCPGGVGVDIKHNSYARRLLKLKAKSVLKQGYVPPNFGTPIAFLQAAPIYGGKTIQTNIVGNNCNCNSVLPLYNIVAQNPMIISNLSIEKCQIII